MGTGPESYVRQKIDENSVEWFPQNRSISLEKGQDWTEWDEKKGDGKINVGALEELYHKLESNVKSIEKLSLAMKSIQHLVEEQQKHEHARKRKAQLRKLGHQNSSIDDG